MRGIRYIPNFIVALLLTTLVHAQEPTLPPVNAATPTPLPAFPIEVNQLVEFNINSFSFALRYSWEASAGTSYTITMENTSGDLDPLLTIFDSSNQEIASNDDIENGNRNARIDFTPSESGTYIIEATRFEQNTGTTTGSAALIIEIENANAMDMTMDPLSLPPPYGVDFEYIDYGAVTSNNLNETTTQRYYVIEGRQGDFVRVILNRTAGDIASSLTIRNPDLVELGRVAQSNDEEIILYATFPETAWYLLVVESTTGSGNFSIFPAQLNSLVIESGQTIQGEFVEDTPILSYVFDAKIGDEVVASVTGDAASTIRPEIAIFDRSFELLAQSTASTTKAQATTTIPRSGTYILQVQNMQENVVGVFNLTLSTKAIAIADLDVKSIQYNKTVQGTILDSQPFDLYRFAAKPTDLVTIEMTPQSENSMIDPYLILMDAELNEISFNDNIGGSSAARITLFEIPNEGEYYILAGRAGLREGTTTGTYNLGIQAGNIETEIGTVSATLRWDGEADLNLFMRTPTGQTISWSRPQVDNIGTLQIDSNTNCETPTNQPIEHVYVPPSTVASGDYIFWVWYQNTCMMSQEVTFDLEVRVFDQEVIRITRDDRVLLEPDQRFETGVRVVDNDVIVLEEGTVTNPAPQQRASQGGDILINFGQEMIGTLDDEVYAQFYQFEGTQGSRVTIQVDQLTGDLDPIIVLRNANDQNLASNDDSADTINSQLSYSLPSDGRYVIAVTRYGLREGTTSGDYRIQLEEDEDY